MEIKCKIINEYNTFLEKILNGIDSEQFRWVISEEEVYKENGDYLFHKNIYENDEFKKLLNGDKYYTVFINIQLYNKDDAIIDIKNYSDFLHSKCKLILFITDNEFVDIYSNEVEIVKVIEKNLLKNNFTHIQINEKSMRNCFSAYTD